MYGYIYKTTNLVNNKIYIGQHKSSTFNFKYKGSGTILREAFKKYEKENFHVEILEVCETQEELNEKEIYYIDLYNSRNPDIGYNISQGGHERFFTGMKHTEESKKKMSEKALNRPHPPTTKGRVCYTNGKVNKLLKEDEVEEYISKGFYKGKTLPENYVVWNKGLTKETNSSMRKLSEDRKERLKNGEVIGYCNNKMCKKGFQVGMKPWNKGLKGYNEGHPYYPHKNKNK